VTVTKASLNQIQEIVERMTSFLGFKMTCAVSADLNGVKIELSGTDGALLIGYHGESLSAFAYVLGLMIHKQIDQDINFRVDINGYLKEKDKKVTGMVMGAIEKVQSSGFPEELEGFNAYERRLAHTLVAKESLISESKGTSEHRILIIRPRKSTDEKSS